ncbi:MFS transporter asaE [Vanrija pseudolonga]|uniref:MFS transporter asaE n=1 Tax=Vanrija pseudolonga TaxID=143232 RepID=A0AAF0YHX8_9TREE|nr:MFS transporter asaE [Vanrija pseudolonga]
MIARNHDSQTTLAASVDGLDKDKAASRSSSPSGKDIEASGDNESSAGASNVTDIGPPPDGGLEAWLVILSAALVTLCLFGFVTGFGQMQSYYLSHQLKGYPKSTVAWISTIQGALVFTPAIIWGRIFDAYGARPLVVSGSVLSVLALIGIAFCKEFYQFFLGHALFGFAASILWTPASAIAGHWFSRHRSLAIGMIVMGTGLGSVVYPILFVQLFKRFSFRNTVLIVAAINVALLTPSFFWLKTRLPPRQPVPFRKLGAPFKETRFAFFALGSMVFMINWMSPMFDAPIVSAANNLPQNITDYAVAILASGSFLSRPVVGILADTFGVWNVFGTISFATSACMFAFWVVSPLPTAAVIVGFFAYGFGSGGWITLVAAVVANISPAHEIGLRVGLVWSICGPMVLIGPVVCGVLIQADGGKFGYAGIFCGVTFFIGSVIEIAPRLIQCARGMLGDKSVAGEKSDA